MAWMVYCGPITLPFIVPKKGEKVKVGDKYYYVVGVPEAFARRSSLSAIRGSSEVEESAIRGWRAEVEEINTQKMIKDLQSGRRACLPLKAELVTVD